MKKSLTHRNKQQPLEAAVLQEKQIPAEVTGRREKSQNSDKQGLGRHAEDGYNKVTRVRAKLPQEERREAASRRHQSGVEANTQTAPIGKESNGKCCKKSDCKSSACVQVTKDTASGKSPADIRN